MTKKRNVTFFVFGLLVALPLYAFGQELAPAGAPSAYAQPGPPYAAQPYDPNDAPLAQAPVYSQQQIDQLVAPIALYPDQLVSQILMASTYPLEIVEAQRWQQNPQNSGLQGPALQSALDQLPWDPSVKSLVPFPQVLSMLNNNLQWTEQLGDAFLSSQPAVMDSVQQLRQRAQAAGNLQSTPQQTVAQQQGDIVIQPTNPQVVYVPYYNPTVVYGTWPYASYPPYYFPAGPGYVYSNYGLLGFGVGLAVLDGLWGWDHWDWRRHEIFVDDRRYAELNRGRDPHFSGGSWEHDPDHRHGVPYHSAAVRQHFEGSGAPFHQGYRGYTTNTQARSEASASRNGSFNTSSALTGAQRPNVNAAQQEQHSNFRHSDTAQRTAPAVTGNVTSVVPRQNNAPETRNINETRTAAPFAPTQVRTNAQATPAATVNQSQMRPNSPVMAQRSSPQQRSSPMFESFARGGDVHTQAERGSMSRASAAPAAASHPAPQAQPQNRGGGGGAENHGGGGAEIHGGGGGGRGH